jgi:hypothetical protein
MSGGGEASRMPVPNATISRSQGVTERSAAPLVVPRRRGGAGRAAVGGLLVVAAAVGVAASWGGGGDAHRQRYVVLAADVVPGQRLAATDLASSSIELPAGQRQVAFTDARVLVGTVALSGMRAGQLVQSGDVAVAPGGRQVEVSVPVDPGSAMNGDRRFLRPGERVDVYVTASDGGRATTRRVAGDATVVDVLAGRDGLGGGGALTVVLAVDEEEVAPVAGAAGVGKVALARTTGVSR